jgi:hypothetical protein
VTAVGNGYIVTLRLVTPDSGAELASFRETGDGPRGLIDAADRLTRELRGKIGESLRTIHASPALARVTTGSLDALRQYSAAVRANNVESDFTKAAALGREAVAIDSTFAGAWRLLAVALGNAGMLAARDSAAERAYRYVDHLAEPERSKTIGQYFSRGLHRDRGKALAAYQSLAQQGDSAIAAINSGEILRGERMYAQAESLNVIGLSLSGTGTAYTNSIELQLDQGKVGAAQAMLDRLEQNLPGNRNIPRDRVLVEYARGNLPRVKQLLDSISVSRSADLRSFGLRTSASLALLRGQPASAERLLQAAGAGTPVNRREALIDSIGMASWDAWLHGEPASGRAVSRIDRALSVFKLHDIALIYRPYFEAATAYARAGRPDKARAVIATYRSDVADTATLRVQAADLHNALGEIALAENKPRDALDEFRRGDVDYDGQPARECGICLDFNLARAFDAAGAADSAITAYERFLSGHYYLRITETDPLGLAFAHRRVAELYDAKGDRQRAAVHYAAFVDQWKNADADLQPHVAEARRRLSSLGAAPAR